MEIPVSAQALTFGAGVASGAGAVSAYDLLRALRRLLPQTGFAADALFGLLLTASFFVLRAHGGAGTVPAVCVPRCIFDRCFVFSDAQPVCAARIPDAFPPAGADLRTLLAPLRFFLEISQKNFKNPLCKFPKMGYNDL